MPEVSVTQLASYCQKPISSDATRVLRSKRVGTVTHNYSQAPIFDLFVWVNDWQDDSHWADVIGEEARGTAKCDPPLPSTRIPTTPVSPW
jgi:hypothetical protein